MTVVTARQALHGLLVYIKTYGKKILGGGFPPLQLWFYTLPSKCRFDTLPLEFWSVLTCDYNNIVLG